jgi:hypothetical protein
MVSTSAGRSVGVWLIFFPENVPDPFSSPQEDGGDTGGVILSAAKNLASPSCFEELSMTRINSFALAASFALQSKPIRHSLLHCVIMYILNCV